MAKKTPEEIVREKEVKEKYKGRYYYKLVFGIAGLRIIRIDKVERTRKFKQIRTEVEHKIAECYLGQRADRYDFDDSMQLMDYAFACDKWVVYHIYKRKILMEDYGIDYLHFLMLNPNR